MNLASNPPWGGVINLLVEKCIAIWFVMTNSKVTVQRIETDMMMTGD